MRTVAQPSQDVATRARERNGTERNGELQDQELSARKRAKPPWVADAIALWSAKVGPLTPAKASKALSPLVTARGWDDVAKGLADYLAATPLSRAKLEWFAERGVYWCDLAQQPLSDPVTCQPTQRYRVVVEGKAA